MKIKKVIMGFVVAFLLVGCSTNDDFELFDEKNSLPNECILDCEIDDGGSGGGTLPEFSNYFYVHKGKINKNVYWVSSNDGANWINGQLGLGAQTSKGPTSIVFNNKRYIFYKGNNSAKIFMSFRTQLSNDWFGNVNINNISETNSSITSTIFDNKIFLAFKGRTNGNLYLAYSSTGNAGSFTQVVALPSNNFVEHYTIATRGNKMYIFWSNVWWDNTINEYVQGVYYKTSTDPTNSNSWSPTYFLEEKLSNLVDEGGLSAVTKNNDIYVTYGTGFEYNNDGHVHRFLTLGKLDQSNVWSTIQYPIDVEDRVGVMATNDSKLLISYINYRGAAIRTMKVNLNGAIETTPYLSGGLTSTGGVASHSRFNQ